jgi:lysophospholipase L1-like esterase
LTFGGQQSVTVPASAVVMSDPVEMPVAPLSRLSVSLYFPQTTPLTTIHWDGLQPAQIAAGNAVNASALKADSCGEQPPLPQRRAGRRRARHAQRGGLWRLHHRRRGLHARHRPALAGLSGAPPGRAERGRAQCRHLGRARSQNHMGPNALARFDRDVLAQPGITSVVLLMGINDISWPGSTFGPGEPATQADALIAGYRQLIARAKSRGVRIVGATLTPFEGALTMPGSPIANYYSPAKDAVRQRINAWIRSSGEFDAVLDFDAVVRDPQNPLRILPAYDSGDHLHLGDAGNKAVAEAIDLKRCWATANRRRPGASPASGFRFQRAAAAPCACSSAPPRCARWPAPARARPRRP